MSFNKRNFPLVVLILDMLGAVLVGVGIAALNGIDFGLPVLVTVAPFLIGIGLLLMAPFVVLMVRQVRDRS